MAKCIVGLEAIKRAGVFCHAGVAIARMDVADINSWQTREGKEKNVNRRIRV